MSRRTARRSVARRASSRQQRARRSNMPLIEGAKLRGGCAKERRGVDGGIDMTVLCRELAPSGSELLLAELVHRINNEFTSPVCIISRAAARSENDHVKATLAAVSERLMDYALVHRTLQMPTGSAEIDASAFMRGLCEAISKSK